MATEPEFGDALASQRYGHAAAQANAARTYVLKETPNLTQQPGTPDRPVRDRAAQGFGSRDSSGYKVKPLSNDEWGKLTASQQRAVAGNQLLYQASQDENARGAIHSFLGYSEENPAPASTNFATMDDIRRFDGNAPGEARMDGWSVRTDSDVLTPNQFDSLTNLADMVNRYSTAVPGQRAGRSEKLDISSILSNGAASVDQYVGRKRLSITDETEKLEPLAKDIAQYDWSTATPEVIKSVEEEIRSAAEGMPLDQALAYLRRRLTSFSEENEDFDSQAIIKFLNIGGSDGS